MELAGLSEVEEQGMALELRFEIQILLKLCWRLSVLERVRGLNNNGSSTENNIFVLFGYRFE